MAGGALAGVTWVQIQYHPLLQGVDCPRKLLLLSTPSRMELAPGTEVLGRYDDASPAITLKHHGKGRVIYFAASPFTAPTLAATDWQGFFGALQKALGFSTGLDIWRFTFPPFETVDVPEPEGVCLTNNHGEWREERQHPVKNLDTQGTYALSPAPDGTADSGGVAEIAFSSGDLTDRVAWPELEKRKAAGYQPYAEPLAKWVDTWQAAGEVSVMFDFRGSYDLARVELWFSGLGGDVRLEGSPDGGAWVGLGTARGRDAARDVRHMTVGADGPASRFARLVFAKSGTESMTLAEVEVWADDGGK